MIKFIVKTDMDRRGIVFELGNHPTIKDLAVVHYRGGTANYDKTDVDHYFDTGMWIKIEN